MAQVDMPKSSIGQTPTEPKKKLEKVVKGKVAVKEQSDMQKIASQFLAEDLKTVKDRILTDYLLPMLKNGAWSMRLQKIGVSTITLLKDEMFFRMVMKFGPTLHWNLGYQCYG